MKGADYKYMICKGNKTVALATSLREAEAEAVRVGGTVHLMPHKNPADPQFRHQLGSGMFSAAYGADDPDAEKKFYAPKGADIERLNYGVESVSKYMPKGLRGAKGVIDIAKTILCLARMEFNAAPGGPDKEALAFLPSIRPVRMDRDKNGNLELIYKMPVYQIWSKGGRDRAKTFSEYIYNRCLSKGGPLNAWEMRLEAALQDPQVPRRWHGKIRALIRVARMIEKLANRLPLKLTGLDLHDQNAAVDKRGNLILLDPIVAEIPEQDAIELWTNLHWDVKPKVVRRS